LINWNDVPDPVDKLVWDRLTSNFWLPEKVPVSNDLASWAKLSQEDKRLVKDVFGFLTLLDTFQSTFGIQALQDAADTDHMEAVLNNIAFMEAVHAKSYSTIFSTLCSSQEIDDLFRDIPNRPEIAALHQFFHGMVEDDSTKFIASVLLESALFYTGFYLPLKLASEGKLTNTADIIRLILRDEGVHGYYIGYKAQKINEYTSEIFDSCIVEFFTLGLNYLSAQYGGTRYHEEVVQFFKYNLNKAAVNLGCEPVFPVDTIDVPAAILAALDPGTGETHDFFSGSGASYVIGKAEETTEEDWSW